MGIAFASTLAQEESFTTVELKINFFRPVWQARLKAEGKVVRRGRTIGYVECTITDEESRLVAKAASRAWCFAARRHQAGNPLSFSGTDSAQPACQPTGFRVPPLENFADADATGQNTSRRDATELSLLSSDRGDGDSHEEKASVSHWQSTSREPRSACNCCARFELQAFPSSCTSCSVCVMLRSSAGRRPVYGKR